VFGLVWFSGSASDNGRWFDLGYATGCGLGTGGTSFDNAGTNFIGLLDSVAWITTSTTVPTGLNSFCWRTTAANSHSMWLNGKQEATSTSTIQAIAEAVPGSGTTLSLGGTWLTGRFSGCSLPLFYVIDGVLSDVDIKALHADPYQLVIPV
jgi:hypothetical protein